MKRCLVILPSILCLGADWNVAGQSTNSVPLLAMTNVWRFNQSGADLGTSWKETNYDDALWPQGAALFYSANASVAAPQNTLLSLTNAAGQPILTYYFRTHFAVTGSTAGLFLVATNFLQAGAVLYLNGIELDRFRLPNGVITASTPGFIGPEAQANTLLLPAASLAQGDNVLAVEVHQNSGANSDIVFGMSLTAATLPPPLPDLIIWGPSVGAHFEIRSFATNDCEVLEGCATPGTRTLLRFATETRNIGTADLVLGNPTNNPLFVYDPCHQHYHFEGYVDFRLLDATGLIAARGRKIGFALVDSERWNTNANPSDHFEQDNQGIQHGWADLYDYLLPCQELDVTGLAPGPYTLELEVDPEHKLPELSETNNITRVSLTLPPNPGVCNAAPPNDLFENAQIVPYRVATVIANTDCATREPSEPMILNNPGGRSVWFRWTSPSFAAATIDTEGSDFDTLLAMFTGAALVSLSTLIANDDGGPRRTSRIVTNVTAGTTYFISVDGYDFPAFGRPYSGNVVLNINPNGNDLFAAAQPLTSSAGTITGSTLTATKETGEPDHAGNAGGHSIWYAWTASFTGTVLFDTFGSRFHTLLAVYTGAIPSLTPVARDGNPNFPGASRVSFEAVAGMTYFIAVDGRDGEAGLCTVNWRPALRLVLAGAPANGSLTFTLLGLAGDRCALETSPDLIQWNLWRQVTNATGSMLFTTPIDAGQKFFRAHTE